MYNGVYQSNGDELVRARLSRLAQELRSLDLPTREEVQAAVWSRLNAVLALGNKVTPLAPVGREGPALAGDVYGNLQILNQDALGIVNQLLALEDEAARLFNLFAASQNNLRQQVREMAFLTTKRRWLETFISDAHLEAIPESAACDFGVGMATLPFVDEREVVPARIETGVLSEGSGAGLEALADGRPETSFVWNGVQLELVFSFEPAAIVNRVRIELDNYQGLSLEALSSTPDGVIQDDIREELNPSSYSLDGSSGKFSGDFTVDFDPRHVKKLRLVLADKAGEARIALRGISFWGRRYASFGMLQSKPIEFPELGLVTFAGEQRVADGLTSITHQVSFDGVQYSHILPGQQIDLGGKKCWYRAAFERIDANFKEDRGAPLEDPGLRPAPDSLCRINNIATVELGGNIVERAINLDLLAKPAPSNDLRVLKLWEKPLPGSLTLYQGVVLLGPEQYQLRGDVLEFSGDEERAGLALRYQIPANAKDGLVARQQYYTPRLYQVSLERVL
jgi:hypothetical protein